MHSATGQEEAEYKCVDGTEGKKLARVTEDTTPFSELKSVFFCICPYVQNCTVFLSIVHSSNSVFNLNHTVIWEVLKQPSAQLSWLASCTETPAERGCTTHRVEDCVHYPPCHICLLHPDSPDLREAPLPTCLIVSQSRSWTSSK